MHNIGVFEFIIILTAIGAFTKLVRHGIAIRSAQASRMSSGQYQSLCERLDKLERRMANLETIVLEVEKRKNFDQAL